MSLSQMPERFRQYDNKSWQNYNVHIMPIDNYCIFYIPNITYSIVTILRVMYSRRNINTHLENSLIKEYR
jgi:toxin ParE1/3/4